MTNASTLTVLRCNACGALDPGPRDLCAKCHSADLAATPVDGTGRLASWTLIRRPPAQFKADREYTVAVVDLAAGVRVVGRLVSSSAEDTRLKIGSDLQFYENSNGINYFSL